MVPLVGARQDYAWGSPTAIPEAIGVLPDGEPWAELWWGTHPGGVTLVGAIGEERPLVDVSGPLPFLVKLLAAEHPLSLQAHPSEEQAREGFEAEQAAGVPLDAPGRVYRDPHGKPEILVALTTFRALCGFRPVEETAAELAERGGVEIAERLRRDGPAATVAWLLRERPAITLADPLFEKLDTAYPGDPGALVAVLLHRVDLAPGEGVYLPAGQMHMYLHGVGLEVMGASDNVVRGGLTTKHVDVTELLRTLDPTPRAPTILRPGLDGWYGVPSPVFDVQAVGPADTWTTDGPEIVVRLAGDGETAAWYAEPGEHVSWSGGLGCRVASGHRSASLN